MMEVQFRTVTIHYSGLRELVTHPEASFMITLPDGERELHQRKSLPDEWLPHIDKFYLKEGSPPFLKIALPPVPTAFTQAYFDKGVDTDQ